MDEEVTAPFVFVVQWLAFVFLCSASDINRSAVLQNTNTNTCAFNRLTCICCKA